MRTLFLLCVPCRILNDPIQTLSMMEKEINRVSFCLSVVWNPSLLEIAAPSFPLLQSTLPSISASQALWVLTSWVLARSTPSCSRSWSASKASWPRLLSCVPTFLSPPFPPFHVDSPQYSLLSRRPYQILLQGLRGHAVRHRQHRSHQQRDPSHQQRAFFPHSLFTHRTNARVRIRLLQIRQFPDHHHPRNARARSLRTGFPFFPLFHA